MKKFSSKVGFTRPESGYHLLLERRADSCIGHLKELIEKLTLIHKMIAAFDKNLGGFFFI